MSKINWTSDKILHYQKGFKYGRRASIFGFMLIALVLAPGKEAFDFIRSKLGQNHKAEWKDYLAGVVGAKDGMLFWKKPKY